MHHLGHITQTLGRVHAFLFVVFIGCFATDAAAEVPSTFLFAQGSCLDDLNAPYSTPATTFNPVIYTMSVSQDMETRPEHVAPSEGDHDAGCDEETPFVVESECGLSSGEEAANEDDSFDGFVLASTLTPSTPDPAPTKSCMASGSKDRCESEPPLPQLTVIDVSTTSGWVDALTRAHARPLVMRVRGHSSRVLAPLVKQPAARTIAPLAPPPRAA